MYTIAIRMLIGDRVKYLILISALAFASLLIIQQAGVFWGVMHWTTAIITNTNVPIWVVDSKVLQVNNLKSLSDTDLARVRSVRGVKWAEPYYSSILNAKQYTGNFLEVQLVGVDSSTLIGIPTEMVKGKLEDLRQSKAVIVDAIGLKKINQDLPKPLGLGDTFDINDHEVKIVGIVKAEQPFSGTPFIYTTYEHAISIAPPTRRTLSAILVQPEKSLNVDHLVKEIEGQTRLKAYTSNEFFWRTIYWFFTKTGIPVSFGSTIVLGFIVGLTVSSQTFYSFVNENLGNFGALKAMGASEALLKRMLLVQVFLAGFIGYGIGLGLASTFGFFSIASNLLPFYLSWQFPLLTFISIIAICLFSVFLSIRKIRQLETSEVFRA